jgi:hypothetical protein
MIVYYKYSLILKYNRGLLKIPPFQTLSTEWSQKLLININDCGLWHDKNIPEIAQKNQCCSQVFRYQKL